MVNMLDRILDNLPTGLSMVRDHMKELTRCILDDMKPALGVTEPGAIAYAAAVARSRTRGSVAHIELVLNSSLYKNAFTCGIPNSDGVGSAFAAALGAIAGDSEKGLEALAGVCPEDNAVTRELIARGAVEVRLGGICPDIYLKIAVTTELDTCEVTIRDSHTDIREIRLNEKVVFLKEGGAKISGAADNARALGTYTLRQLYEYAASVELHELFFLRKAFAMNMELFEEGLQSKRTSFAPCLCAMNGGKTFSRDAQNTAQLLCNVAIEARVLGLGKSAMSISGSGAHGIICTLPLYALHKTDRLPEEKLLRAAALSFLITMYIKEHSGRLSAFCGCAIAAGTGAACGLTYLKGGSFEQIRHTVNNMASSVTGMICDGGNPGCVLKGVVAVDAAFKAAELSLGGAFVSDIHGINGNNPEQTLKNMGLIASPGMIGTEETILKILEAKRAAANERS